MRTRIERGKIRARIFGLGAERNAISERIRANQLSPDDRALLLFLVRITPWILSKLKKRTFLVSRLKDMLWGKKSESARDILKEINTEAASEEEATTADAVCPLPLTPILDDTPSCDASEHSLPIPPNQDPPAPCIVIPINKKKRKYPKNRKPSPRGKAAFPNVVPIEIVHEQCKSGDPCPKCLKGRMYKLKRMGVFLKWVGQSLLRPIIYLQEQWRCNNCGWISGATMPQDVTSSDGSDTASAMIAVLKYGCGFPFYRFSKMQGWFKLPISPSTLWNKMKDGLLDVAEVIWNHMRTVAAQGEIIHNDDTIGKILSLMEKTPKDSKNPRLPSEVKPKKKPRKAVSTTGILSKAGNLRILLFFTGHANAGENLEELLNERDKTLKPATQMSDASTTNRPGLLQKVIETLCLTHGRRGFIRAYRSAKKACTFVILKLQEVYKIEAQAKREGLTPEERLKLHQEKSGPVMKELKTWFDLQIETKQVEPNSPLGEAIQYMRNHWPGLTAFLSVPGAPLTNDELEQAFKNVKIHLKNSLFYKTLFGAKVGDMMMSVIHTTVLCGENPWEYLVEIQRNREAVKLNPGAWMPWNFRQAIHANGDSKMSA
jgi:transposase